MKKLISILLIIVSLCTICLLIGCAGSKEKVVIYSCMEEERNQDLKKMLKDKFPELNVVVQHMATGNVAAKFKTEGTGIEADILIDLETAYISDLVDNLASLSSFDSSVFVDGAVKSEYYFPWTKYTMSLIVDEKYLNEHNLSVPTSYEDLLKPEYKNLIAIPDPKTSGTGYGFLLNTINIMGEEKAFEYFKSLKDNLREFTTSGSGPTNLLKQGEIAIAMGMTSQGAQCINDGYNFKIVCLDTGAPYNTTSAGIVKGRETNESVKKVFEWLNTEFTKYDKENYLPDIILKNQENKVKNYPTNFSDANMDGIDDISKKNAILEKWGEING